MTEMPRSTFRPEALTLPPAACFAALKPLAPAGAHLAAISKTHWGLYGGKPADQPERTLPVALVMELSKAKWSYIWEVVTV